MVATRVVLRACTACHLITEDDTCPRCANPTSRDWSGMVCVVDCDKSEIARKMGITANGNYALKVRT